MSIYNNIHLFIVQCKSLKPDSIKIINSLWLEIKINSTLTKNIFNVQSYTWRIRNQWSNNCPFSTRPIPSCERKGVCYSKSQTNIFIFLLMFFFLLWINLGRGFPFIWFISYLNLKTKQKICPCSFCERTVYSPFEDLK